MITVPVSYYNYTLVIMININDIGCNITSVKNGALECRDTSSAVLKRAKSSYKRFHWLFYIITYYLKSTCVGGRTGRFHIISYYLDNKLLCVDNKLLCT